MFLYLLIDLSVPPLFCGCALLPSAKEKCCETPLTFSGGSWPTINSSPAPPACSHSSQLSLFLFARLDIKQQDCSCQEVQRNAALQNCSNCVQKKVVHHPALPNYSYCPVFVVTIRARNGAPPGKAFTTAATRCSAHLSWERPQQCLPQLWVENQLPHLLHRFSIYSYTQIASISEDRKDDSAQRSILWTGRVLVILVVLWRLKSETLSGQTGFAGFFQMQQQKEKVEDRRPLF